MPPIGVEPRRTCGELAPSGFVSIRAEVEVDRYQQEKNKLPQADQLHRSLKPAFHDVGDIVKQHHVAIVLVEKCVANAEPISTIVYSNAGARVRVRVAPSRVALLELHDDPPFVDGGLLLSGYRSSRADF